uniref:Taste 1 receptor member 1 n=1 Tax=Cyanoderma ruficeps TaxID=181631 RepID=A0A8C3QH18_9PASS
SGTLSSTAVPSAASTATSPGSAGGTIPVRVKEEANSRQAASVRHGYCLSQALRFAVEEINNSSTLLPNVTLGYEIYDTCSEPTNFHATLCALARKGRQDVQVLSSFQHYEPQAVAVIGPDSTRLALTTAAVLSLFLVPEVTSTESLSLKRLYPSFLRTIPSDRQQVKAIFSLLQHFGWTWVVLLGSDNTYGRAGLDALQELLSTSNVCVAYRGTIPANSDANNPELHNLVRILTDVKVNVTVVFSNRGSVLPFFEVVVQRNITDMVWVASEDWSLAQIIWQVPGIQTIGSVFGMAVEKPESTMLERFEAWKMSEEGAGAECASSAEAGGESVGNAWLDCTQCCTSCRALATVPDMYDAQGSFNVYSAVYAVAHGLHDLLGCASGTCSKSTVYPWQVRATLWKIHEDSFPQGRVFPFCLEVSCLSQRLKSHSVCSEACQPGEMRLQQSRHKCCFSCVACPAGTFLNRSDPFDCQACGLGEWAPAGSEVCFSRTIEFLSWSEPLSWALLAMAVLLMLLIAGLAVLFALNISTPVVKSAGGKTCFLMLGSLACTCSSLFCYFGEPSRVACLLRVPLCTISFTVFLSCVATRCFQILCIFKLNARCPALYEAWMRRQGPVLFVAASTAAQVVLCVVVEAVSPSVPRREYGARDEWVVLECAQSGAADAAIAYTVLLSAGCFALSYAGTDLPAAYNEAKSLTVSLLLHLACSAAVLCSQGALRGRAETAVRVLSTLGTLAALLAGDSTRTAPPSPRGPALGPGPPRPRALRRHCRRPLTPRPAATDTGGPRCACSGH